MAIAESTSQQLDSKSHLVRNHNSNMQLNSDPEPLDFEECLKDSPKFRQNLKENLAYVENLELCMSRTIKHITNYIETGRDHIKAHKDFINSMRTLNSSLGVRNLNVSKRVDTLLGTLEEIMQLHEIVIDQSARTVGTSLSKFINDDLQKIKEARKSFDKIGHEYDQALTRHSQPVKKQQDDSENLLIATSTAFTHTSLDLTIQITALQSKKGSDILGSLLSFTKAHSTFFHQGSDLFEDIKPHISDMDEFLSNIQDEFETLVRSLPSKHLMVSNNELRPICFDNKADQVHLEGYLFKRASNGFKVWNRRWFILKDHQLLYQKRGDTQPTVMEDDVRLLTVRSVDKADIERRFCFEVLSPQKSHILQADSEAACKTWMSAIQAGINAAFHDIERKSLPRPATIVTSSDQPTSGLSSWSSGFSFKALQQQATNRLTSIATSSEHKDNLSKGSSKEKLGRQDSVPSGDDNEGENDQTFKVDEQGRTYAPLRDDDDDIDDDVADGDTCKTTALCPNTNPATAIYPVAAKATTSVEPVVPPVKPQRAYMIILKMPGNDVCADCGAAQPKWASINLGITLCIECAGIHRSLGVHLSKVRSLTLDTEVWSPEIVQLMLNLGNTSVNSAYLACYRDRSPPINEDSCREDRESWIKSKYLLKSFMRPDGESCGDDETSFLENNLSPNELSRIGLVDKSEVGKSSDPDVKSEEDCNNKDSCKAATACAQDDSRQKPELTSEESVSDQLEPHRS